MICRVGINDRIKRYGQLLTAIETEQDLYEPDSPLQSRLQIPARPLAC